MLTDLFNELGATILPDVFDEIATDTLNIARNSSVTSDSGGGVRKGSNSNLNTNPLPCLIRPISASEEKKADKRQNSVWYLVTFPLTEDGSTILSVTEKMRLSIIARGIQPARTLEIIGIKNTGVLYEATCVLET